MDYEFENDPTSEYHDGDEDQKPKPSKIINHYHRHTFIPAVFDEAFTPDQQRAYLKKLIDELMDRVDKIEEGGVSVEPGEPVGPGESVTVVGYEFDDEGNTLVEFSDGSVVVVKKGRDGEPGKPGKNAEPLTVTSTEFDAEGDTIISFSDGSTAVVRKGKDGEDGKNAEPLTVVGETTDGEGNTLVEFSDGSVITIHGVRDGGGESTPLTVAATGFDEDGNTTVTFSDDTTIVVHKGQDGKDGDNATPLTVTSTEYGEGNTVVTFSDDSTVVVRKGQDGKDGFEGLSAYELWLDAGNTGTLGDFFTTLAGEDGEDGVDAAPLTVTSTEFDDEGNTVVTFSDGSVVEVNKGEDGDDGQDGVSPPPLTVTETRTDEENTTITFSDGSEAVVRRGLPGQDGKDAAPLTVATTEFDAEGNTVVFFSDGTDAVVRRGQPGQDGKDGKDGSTPPPLTVTDTTFDSEGHTAVTFSDGATAVVRKGQDGKDGDDGVTPHIGENGNWWIYDTDTGVQAQGEDGESADPLTVTSSEYDSEGNTVITFSDGSTVIVLKGQDGEDTQGGGSAIEVVDSLPDDPAVDTLYFVRRFTEGGQVTERLEMGGEVFSTGTGFPPNSVLSTPQTGWVYFDFEVDGSAYLFIQVDGPNGVDSTLDLSRSGSGWTRYSNPTRHRTTVGGTQTSKNVEIPSGYRLTAAHLGSRPGLGATNVSSFSSTGGHRLTNSKVWYNGWVIE